MCSQNALKRVRPKINVLVCRVIYMHFLAAINFLKIGHVFVVYGVYVHVYRT